MDRAKVFGNFINGAWTEGSGEYANTNPSDTRDVIGRYFPPMALVVVAALLEDRALVEIEATAVVP